MDFFQRLDFVPWLFQLHFASHRWRKCARCLLLSPVNCQGRSCLCAGSLCFTLPFSLELGWSSSLLILLADFAPPPRLPVFSHGSLLSIYQHALPGCGLTASNRHLGCLLLDRNKLWWQLGALLLRGCWKPQASSPCPGWRGPQLPPAPVPPAAAQWQWQSAWDPQKELPVGSF